MAKRKTEAAMVKMQPDIEEVKAEEHPPEEKLTGESETGSPTIYKIVCRNKITKRIGGVDFTEGEGYTTDGFAASWFAAKDGYTVEPAE